MLGSGLIRSGNANYEVCGTVFGTEVDGCGKPEESQGGNFDRSGSAVGYCDPTWHAGWELFFPSLHCFAQTGFAGSTGPGNQLRHCRNHRVLVALDRDI